MFRIIGISLVLVLTSFAAHARGAIDTGAAHVAGLGVTVVGGEEYAQATGEDTDNTVCVVDQGSLKSIWSREGIKIRSLRSPAEGEVVAFLEYKQTVPGGPNVATTPTLRVINLQGKTVAEVPDVYAFAFSPKGTAVVCVQGTYSEDYPGFDGYGLAIVPLDDGQKRMLKLRGYDISWATHDGKVYAYVWDQELSERLVIRVDPETGHSQHTEYRGIYFSPQGTYYYYGGYEGTPVRVYRTADNKDLTPTTPYLAVHAGAVEAIGWVDDATLLVEAAQSGDHSAVSVIPGNESIRKIEGMPVPNTANSDGLLTVTDQGLKRIILEKLPLFSAGLDAAAADIPPAEGTILETLYEGKVLAPKSVNLAPSGENFSISHAGESGHFTAFYVEGEKLLHTSLPGNGGRWVETEIGDVLEVELPESKVIVALPPYDDVQDFRADIANGVAASAFQSLAIAAWTYCESSVSTLAKQEYVDSYIDSADLARKTREHFVERVQIPEASPGRSVHFMYGDFAAPQGLQHGRMAELRVEADGEVFDLTQGMGYVDDYTYADEGQRVCIMRPTGTQIRA